MRASDGQCWERSFPVTVRKVLSQQKKIYEIHPWNKTEYDPNLR